jgi:uncharacterized protein (TIGR00369 family)
MDLSELFAEMPFNEHLGIELVDAEDGHATGRLELSSEHSSNPDRLIAHGGVMYALADSVAGAAVVSANFEVTPTIDMRIDYLAPATGGILHAEAEVVHNGDHVAAVDVEIADGDGEAIATARGTYKSGGGSGDSAWTDRHDE